MHHSLAEHWRLGCGRACGQGAPRSLAQPCLRRLAPWSSSLPASAPSAHRSFAAAAAAAPKQDDAASPTPASLPTHCSGCGIPLQREDEDAPGFYQLPKRLTQPEAEAELMPEEAVPPEAAAADAPPDTGEASAASSPAAADADKDAVWAELDSLLDQNEELWEGRPPKRWSFTRASDEEAQEAAAPTVLCARCYSLQHYGAVRSQRAEAALPQFDLARRVGRKIALQRFRRPVLLCCVDVADFDGSLPRTALQALLASAAGQDVREAGRQDCRLILAINKADLLPPQVTQLRLEAWVRRRMQQAGLPRPDAVHRVSSTKHRGVADLLEELHRAAGAAGDVWVVGAQNAGKSSLINAMRRAVGRTCVRRDVTAAPLPGTTLGVLRVDGVMQGRGRMFDTPGVPHPHQLSSRLSPEEVRLLLPRARLRPRTFRVAAGQTLFVGGVARLDVVHSSCQTLYLTVWASSDVPCHFGRTAGADERYGKLAGGALMPPLGGAQRLAALGPLLPAEVAVEGGSFKASSVDVAVAGLGWVGVALGGTARLRVWTHEGVAVTVREALVPDLATALERPGLGNRTRATPRAAKKARRSN